MIWNTTWCHVMVELETSLKQEAWGLLCCSAVAKGLSALPTPPTALPGAEIREADGHVTLLLA